MNSKKKLETHHLHIYLKKSRCKVNFHQRETPGKTKSPDHLLVYNCLAAVITLSGNRMPVINHSNPPPTTQINQPTYPDLCECFNHLRIWYLAIFTIFQGRPVFRKMTECEMLPSQGFPTYGGFLKWWYPTTMGFSY